MSDELVIPDEAVKYILFQRTKFLKFNRTFVYRVLDQLFPRFHNWAVGMESKFGKDRVKSLYAAEMKNEFQTLVDALPKQCSALLDIGCGIAGVDAFLYQHYSQKNDVGPQVYLLDKSEIEDKVYYQFNDRTAFYNSLDLAQATLTGSGVPADSVHPKFATDDNQIDIDQPLDLILSLRSWGYHYPVETYLDKAYDRLANGGVLILDLSRGNTGFDVLKAKFGNARIIQTGESHDRVAAVKEA